MSQQDAHWQHTIPSRPWSRAERRVVVRGFLGRLSIAIEPLVVALFFCGLPLAMYMRGQKIVVFLAPIFILGAILFLVYAIALMVPPIRALRDTFRRIYMADGYVRYRCVLDGSIERYYVGVLDHEKRQLAEWPLSHRPPALDQRELWAALVEFSVYGGIHRIDGRSTGILPDALPPLGIGASQPRTEGETTP